MRYCIWLMRPDALVFDLDGTLWDAAAASVEGWNLALEKMGVASQVDLDGIRSVSGTPFVQCVETLLPTLRPATAAILDALEAGERRMIEAKGGLLYSGVADGLPRLAAIYPLFLVSNCPEWYLEAFLRLTGLGECFTGWDSHGSSGQSKSAMLEGLRAHHQLERAMYVGDTHGDRQAADMAGMEFVYVRYGFGSTEGPAIAFDHFDALVEHFTGLTG